MPQMDSEKLARKTLNEVAKWLGFKDALGFGLALEKEKRDVFKRATY